MKRREFINWIGLGAIASYLPIALVACSEDNTVAEDIADTELLAMGTVAQLDSANLLLNKEAKVMVVKNGNGELMAVNPTCTHKGCIVEWQAKDLKFICPCHDAKFSADGKVLAEPAKSPLPTYEVEEQNGEILVRVV